MMDLFFILALMFAIAGAMAQHGMWKQFSGLGDCIAWLMVCSLALILVRFPVYLYLYGWRCPFNASDTAQFVTGLCAVGFWWAMVYWQVPGRIARLFKKG